VLPVSSGSALQVSTSVHVQTVSHVLISHVHVVSQVLASLHVSTFTGSLGDVAITVKVDQVFESELDSLPDRYSSAFSSVI
jgi:hypothetical protein